MAAYYLMAAEGVWRRVRRRLPVVLAWAAFAGIVLAPFACAFLLGRANCP